MNLEPIRALIKLAGDLENQLYEGDGAYPEDYHDVHTSAVVALPALSQLLEAVEGMERLEKEWLAEAKFYKSDRDGSYPAYKACTDAIHRLLHPEDK